MRAKAMAALAGALVLLTATGAQAELKEISFRNKQDGSLKLYCIKNKGKLKTSISCDGKLFTPDADWEEIKAEKVCFRNSEDRMRTCHELSKPGGTKKGYVCFDQKEKPFSFSPGKEWTRLAESDKACGELIHGNVIRHTDMPPLDIDL